MRSVRDRVRALAQKNYFPEIDSRAIPTGWSEVLVLQVSDGSVPRYLPRLSYRWRIGPLGRSNVCGQHQVLELLHARVSLLRTTSNITLDTICATNSIPSRATRGGREPASAIAGFSTIENGADNVLSRRQRASSTAYNGLRSRYSAILSRSSIAKTNKGVTVRLSAPRSRIFLNRKFKYSLKQILKAMSSRTSNIGTILVICERSSPISVRASGSDT